MTSSFPQIVQTHRYNFVISSILEEVHPSSLNSKCWGSIHSSMKKLSQYLPVKSYLYKGSYDTEAWKPSYRCADSYSSFFFLFSSSINFCSSTSCSNWSLKHLLAISFLLIWNLSNFCLYSFWNFFFLLQDSIKQA